MKAGLIDYGMGNLASVAKAIERAGATAVVSEDTEELARADVLVMPGVGNFAAGIHNLESRRQDSFIKKWHEEERPLLGICLGMQLMFETSEEGESRGLGLIPGRVRKIGSGVKVPHIGWNVIRAGVSSPLSSHDGRRFYFDHSYVCQPETPVSIAECDYGEEFCAAVRQDNVWGVQFHPEKSSTDGVDLLGKLLVLACR